MRLLLVLLMVASHTFLFGQEQNTSKEFSKDQTQATSGLPFTAATYPGALQPGESHTFTIEPDHLFSCFGVGFDTDIHTLEPDRFGVSYRTQRENGEWSEWHQTTAEVHPSETPTHKFWTDALFTLDATSQVKLELRLTVPVIVNSVQVDLFDGNYKSTTQPAEQQIQIQEKGTPASGSRANCPNFPTIIPRSNWCGGSAPCWQVNSGYTPTYINAGHVVIHHGASPNTYSDGQAVVRSYYNYHVNTLGWADIGYNYLIDKYGNFYQGRHNPNLPTSDVRAAHAGAANSGSIGINFLGNLDVTLATPAQLSKLYDVMAWWFDHKALSPLASANMQTQAYGVQYMERITCHRDIGSTSCPGNDMYSRMATIRQETQNVLDNCNNQTTDNDPPTTLVSSTYDWRGDHFWINFDDTDNPGGSGVEEQYYQVLEYDGNEWRANADSGFFNDNFNTTLHSDWTSAAGSWTIDNDRLYQSDETVGNTNIYTDLAQTDAHAYLYQWSARMDGTGSNRRSGIHFFADAPTQSNRGNSYLVYFRADNNTVQIYKVINNNINLEESIPYTIDAATWYDYKVTYDPVSGEIAAFVDNERVAAFTDLSPLTSGSHISMRSGNAQVRFDNLKVRKSRDFQEKITVGPSAVNEAHFESPNNQQDACRINSIVKDGADNWSNQNAKHIYVDWTHPTSSGSVPSNWQTTDFSTNFQDADNTNGSGVMKAFYQVIDYDGIKWRGNADYGFYSDNFSQGALDPAWSVESGSWNVNNGYLEQTDEAIGNSNIYTYVKSDLSNRYLYHFQMKLDGAGNNRRGGIHYFCDDPSATNRGNSYFVWFRQELQTLEFYSVSNDTFTQQKVVPISFDANTWMDVKIAYDRITGETFVYKDDKLIGDWQDNTPLTDGDYVSFRSGHSNMSVNNFKVYRSRYPTVQVSVGTANSEVRYQNASPSNFSAKVKSIIQDSAQNLSAIDYLNLNIDWTPPATMNNVSDVGAVDADTFYTINEITAYWSAAQDPHSAINFYEMSVGTSTGDSNVVAWTPVGNVTDATLSGLSLIAGQMYYVNLRAVNNAGLKSGVVSSDGQYLHKTAGLNTQHETPFVVYPNPFDTEIQLKFPKALGKATVRLFAINGQLIKKAEKKSDDQSMKLSIDSDLASGTYYLTVQTTGGIYRKKVIH